MSLTPDPLSSAAVQHIAKTLNQALESPLKEVGNFIADKVRYLRYKSLLKIVTAADALAREEGMLLKMPPLKFFVPFCEGASLEEDDEEALKLTELQEMWKRLLISASEQYDSRQQVFARILREITRDEVEFLRRMIDGSRATTFFRASSSAYEDSCVFRPYVIRMICEEARSLGDDELGKLVIDCLECPGVLFYAVMMGRGAKSEGWDETSYIFESEWYHSDKRRASHALLESLGIIRAFDLEEAYFDGERFIEVEGIQLTELGAGFIEKCTDLGQGFRFIRRIYTNADDGTISYKSM